MSRISAGHKLAAAAFVAGLAICYAILLAHPYFGLYHDDGLYIANAKSLTDGGGYRNLTLPGEPPQTKYPPLFPAMLSAVWRCWPHFPDNLIALRLLALAGAGLWAVATYRLLLLWLLPAESLWLALIGSVGAMNVLVNSNWVLPDCWYAFWLTSGLCWGVAAESSGDRKAALLSGLLFGLAVLTRTMGIVPAAAVGLVLLLRRRWTAAGIFGVTVWALYGPWLWWASQFPAPADPVLRYYTNASYTGGHIFAAGYSLAERGTVLLWNTVFVMMSPVSLLGLTWSPLWAIFGLFALFCVIAGWVQCFRTGGWMVPVVWLVHLAMLIAWVWPPQRYMIPLQALFAAFGYLGAKRMLQGWPPRRLKIVGAAVLVLVCGVEWKRGYDVVSGVRATGFPTPDPVRVPIWRYVQTMTAAIREKTPPDAVLAGSFDPALSLLTGRKAIRTFAYHPFELFYTDAEPNADSQVAARAAGLERLIRANQVGYVVVFPFDLSLEDKVFRKSLERLRASEPGLLQNVSGIEPDSLELLEVRQKGKQP